MLEKRREGLEIRVAGLLDRDARTRERGRESARASPRRADAAGRGAESDPARSNATTRRAVDEAALVGGVRGRVPGHEDERHRRVEVELREDRLVLDKRA